MSIYTPGTYRRHGDDDEEEDKLGILTDDHENDKLFQIMCNYLSLAQFELARTVLDQLFTLAPERCLRVLRSLALSSIPQKWLFSDQVPTGAHLAWLACMEYKYLHRLVTTADRLPEDNRSKKVWTGLLKKYMKTDINPLGFVNRGRMEIRLLEASGLKLFPRKGLARGYPLAYFVELNLEGSTYQSKDTAHADQPQFGHTFESDLYFADSTATFSMYARRPYKNARNATDHEEDLIGQCSLPLHQLRGKEEYHIWIPLEAPEAEEQGMGNPFKQSKKARGTGLSQVARPNYGRIRLRVRWSENGRVEAGLFDQKILHALETDLLMHASVYNSRKAFHAAQRKVPGSLPEYQSARGLFTGVPEDGSISGDFIQDTTPLLSEEVVGIIREYASGFLKSDSALSEFVRSGQQPQAFLLNEARGVFPQMRKLIWALPPAGYALTAKLQELERTSLTIDAPQQRLTSVSKFESMYAQLIAEMLLKRDFSRAAQAVYHFTHDAMGGVNARRSSLLDLVLEGLVTYLHNIESNPESLTRSLRDLLEDVNTGEDKRIIVDLEIGGIEEALKAQSDARGDEKEQELYQYSNEYVVRAQQTAVLMKSKIYSALLGTPNEAALQQFCLYEDQYDDPTMVSPNKAEQESDPAAAEKAKYAIPACFVELDRAFSSLDQMKDLSPYEKRRQQEQSLVTFFSGYYTYIRVTNQHVLQYVVKKALGLCKGRSWKDANIVLRPFSELRPLVILLAWDEFEDEFRAREELITEVWHKRPSFPSGECREPRLIEWCNRLDFNVQLINAVLDFVDGENDKTRTRLAAREKNDRAIRLLDTLRLHSTLYAFRDSLPNISPTVLVELLNRARTAQDDRGQECEHDVHVLRSFYAIRGLMGVMIGDLHDAAYNGDVPLGDGAAQATVIQEKKQPEAKHADSTDTESDDDSDDGKQARAPASTAPAKTKLRFLGDKGARISVLDAVERHVVGMTKIEFQVTTLEKMFSLVFMQEEDIITEVEKAARRAEQHKRRMEFMKEKMKQTAAMNARDDSDGMLAKPNRDMSESSVNSAKAELNDVHREQDEESPMLVSDVDKLMVLLKFMQRVTQSVSATMNSRHKDNPSPQDQTNFARIGGLQSHIKETLWRCGVLKQKGMLPTVSLLSAPMESISTVFLKMDGADRPSEYLGNPLVADKWRQLCTLVRARARRRGKEVVSGVIDFIVNYYKDPATKETVESEDPQQHFAAVMQGFFFAMDVTVVFNHLLKPRDVQGLVDWATHFLEHTMPQLSHPAIVELHSFYKNFALHYRDHYRAKFDVTLAFKKASIKKDEERKRKKRYVGMNELTVWVHTYRMSQRARRQGNEYLLDGGWLTSTTGMHEDEVRARIHVPFTESYQAYTDDLELKGVSDDLNMEQVQGRMQDDVGRESQSPWEGLEVLSLLTQIADDGYESHQRRMEERGPLPEEKKLEIDERLERIHHRMAALGKLTLPSLAAIRHLFRYSAEDAIPLAARVARERSTFLPTFARWVRWRTRVWEDALRLLHVDNDMMDMLGDDVREVLAREDVGSDQKAFVRLIKDYVRRGAELQGELNVAQKMKLLELADANLSGDSSIKAQQTIQGLLVSVVDDPRLKDHFFRARCIMRLKDIVWATQMALKYVDQWEDMDMCLTVLMKCVTDLMPTHPLRPAAAFRYNIITIYKEIVSLQDKAVPMTEKNVALYMSQRTRARGAIKENDRKAIDRMFSSWQGFHQENKNDLARVVLTLLDADQLSSAQKLFELYQKCKSIKGMKEGYTLPDEETEELVEDKIIAAVIADMLSPRPKPGQSAERAKTTQRVAAMKRLNEVPDRKKFRIVRFMVDLLYDAPSRFIAVEYLRRFVDMQRNARLVREELEEEEASGVFWDEVALANMDQRTQEFKLELGDLEEKRDRLPALPDTAEEKYQAAALDERLTFVRAGLMEYRNERRQDAFDMYNQKQLRLALQRAERRRSARAIAKPMNFTDEQYQWLSVLVTSSKLLMMMSKSDQANYVSEWRDPKTLMRGILEAGRVNLALKAFEFFKKYDGSIIDRFDNAVLPPEYKPEPDADNEVFSTFNSYTFVLDFAREALTLKHKGIGKDLGFAVFDMCTKEEAYVEVATCCLDTCNELSSILHFHEHSLFILHLMKSVLTYTGVKLLAALEKRRGQQYLVDRFRSYRQLVFTPQELAELDGEDADPSSPQKLSLLYDLRRVEFSIDDLLDVVRARALQQRLVRMDKPGLARRVWEDTEAHIDEEEEYDEKLMAFKTKLRKQNNIAKKLAYSFDRLPAGVPSRTRGR